MLYTDIYNTISDYQVGSSDFVHYCAIVSNIQQIHCTVSNLIQKFETATALWTVQTDNLNRLISVQRDDWRGIIQS